LSNSNHDVRRAAIQLILSAAKAMQVSSVEEIVSKYAEEFKNAQAHVIQSLEAQWEDSRATSEPSARAIVSKSSKTRPKTVAESHARIAKSPPSKSPSTSPTMSRKPSSLATKSSPVKESRKGIRRSLAEELAGFSWEK
jgi:hypothetical protein